MLDEYLTQEERDWIDCRDHTALENRILARLAEERAAKEALEKENEVLSRTLANVHAGLSLVDITRLCEEAQNERNALREELSRLRLIAGTDEEILACAFARREDDLIGEPRPSIAVSLLRRTKERDEAREGWEKAAAQVRRIAAIAGMRRNG